MKDTKPPNDRQGEQLVATASAIRAAGITGVGEIRAVTGKSARIAITADLKVPLCVDDMEMDYSWRMIPLAPDADPGWVILDSSHDRRTTWIYLGDGTCISPEWGTA